MIPLTTFSFAIRYHSGSSDEDLSENLVAEMPATLAKSWDQGFYAGTGGL